ncbi:hypothetical protein [Streptomyces sp. NPDC086782]|uniref:deoxynucleotide monophosphate kinase family protein n=1 Tax=Streptomyces sp. NPDC086782 TaxID=3365757 RepID=UPI00382C16D9
MGNIGIIGRARVGKDTAGAWLVENRGYRRVALADPLKAAALELDPIVEVTGVGDYYRLGEEVARWGWEGVKDDTPEVRRILQELGRAIRTLDPDFWLRAALKKTQEANDAGVPVVITDVRYPNEAASLRRAGFHLIHIHRPDVPQLDHESEGALGTGDAGYTLLNTGTIRQLHVDLEAIVDRIYALESRKHLARL